MANVNALANTQPPSPTSTVAQNASADPAPFNPDVDIERSVSVLTASGADPYNLRHGVLTDDALTRLRSSKGKGRRVAKFQDKQNDLISYLLKPMEAHTSEAQDEADKARLPVKIAVWASLIANFGLCVIQMYAAISSLSLSLLATGIDSVFDIGSNILLFWLHRKSTHLDVAKWPVGGARLECIGNIVYGFLMGAVNMIVAVESVRSIVSKKNDDLQDFHLASIIAVAAALGVKVILFLVCMPFRHNSSQVMMLWEDHRNDLFINGFGILMSAGGSKWKWWLDPAGAIIIAVGIIASWTRTVHGEFELLAGKAASQDFLQLVVYKSVTFDEGIEKIDTVRAYHSGPTLFVEVDIVMDGATPLWKAHDVSQALQDALELLPGVGRVFVHVDWESEHRPEHRKGV